MTQLGVDEVLRILLVGEEQAICAELDQALSGQVDHYKIDWVAQPDLAPVRAKDTSPQLILLDHALGDSDIASLIRQLHSELPAAPILALIPTGDVELARRAVLAGARGFINKPLASSDLIATFSQLLLQKHTPAATDQRKPAATGRIVAYCGAKGGTGCTTLLVNSGLALRKITRQSVTLVDANFATPTLPLLLNLLDVANISDLVEHLPRVGTDLLDRVLSPHTSGVRVLQAPLPGANAHSLTVTQMQQILVNLKRSTQWVFVDLGIATDPLAFAVLDAADQIVVTMLPEMPSLTSTQLLLDRLRDRGYADSKTWLTLNRATLRPSVAQSEIERRLRLPVQHAVANDPPLVSHSLNRGIPFVSSHETSALARSMFGLARHLQKQLAQETNRSTQPNAATERSNPFQRWLRGSQAIQV